MTVIITGTVRACTSFYTIPRPGARSRWYVRLVADQLDNGAAFETTLDAGEGFAGLTKADALRTRLRIGAQIEAHGHTLQLRPSAGDKPALLLIGARFVRGGEQPKPRANHLPVPQLKAMAAPRTTPGWLS